MSLTPGPWIADIHRIAGSYGILASHRGKYGEPVYVGYVAKKRDAIATAAVPEIIDLLRDIVKGAKPEPDLECPQTLDKIRSRAAKILRRIEGVSRQSSGG